MFLAINIGNANIQVAAYAGETMLFRSQLRTDPLETADEYAIGLRSLLVLYGVPVSELENAMLSCVAPTLASTLRQAVGLLREERVLTVGPGLKTGLNIGIDIAAELGVTKPSVSYATKRLRENGYIIMDQDGLISLTDSGYEIARHMYDRHRMLTAFLVSLGVPEEIAREDACKMEHDISEESFTAICKSVGWPKGQ